MSGYREWTGGANSPKLTVGIDLNNVDVPNFYNEHRSISELDADDISEPALENWFSLQLVPLPNGADYLNTNINYSDCSDQELFNKEVVYTLSGEAKVGEDFEADGYIPQLGYGVVNIDKCRGYFGIKANEDKVTEGDETVKLEIWSDRNYSELLHSSEFSIIDTSLNDPSNENSESETGNQTTIINNNTTINNNITNNTNTNITNNGNGNINTGNIGTVENTTNVQNTFSIQTIPINLANAITGDSRRKETVKGTTGDDLIADGAGKDELIGNDGADNFYFSGEEPYKKELADRILDFDASEGDAILIDEDVVSNPAITDKVIDNLADTTATEIPVAENNKQLKQLSDDGHQFIYNERKGELLLDDNGKDKGFAGKDTDPLIANLGKKTELTDALMADVFDDLEADPSLAIAESKKQLKSLAKDDYDLIYFEPKGDLYVDGNGSNKGFGNKADGGLIADLPNNSTLSEENLLIAD